MPVKAAVRLALCLGLVSVAAGRSWAQARNPFGVGISEGGGSAQGLTGWILAQQGWFEHHLSLAVRALHGPGGVWPLVGLSFAYGVFHAAGPGHGKAVLASYMVANERAWRRGVILSLAAALLQGLVAVLLVGVLALGLHATAQRMKDAASLIEMVSFMAIVALGIALVWRKGRGLILLLASTWVPRRPALMVASSGAAALSFRTGGPAPAGGARFVCVGEDVDTFDPSCAHCRAVDPARLGERRFALSEAASTVFAAGVRPCSGAILVLVFALSQGLFAAGVLSVLAMAVGVATTTAALATLAVFLKGAAERVVGRHSHRAAMIGAMVEFAAAVLVLGAGVLMLAGVSVTGGA